MPAVDRFARRVFLIAAIYGFVALIPRYFMEARIGIDYPLAITHPEHFYGFIGVALAWQFAILLIARDSARYRLFMLPAILEKLGWAGAWRRWCCVRWVASTSRCSAWA